MVSSGIRGISKKVIVKKNPARYVFLKLLFKIHVGNVPNLFPGSRNFTHFFFISGELRMLLFHRRIS